MLLKRKHSKSTRVKAIENAAFKEYSWYKNKKAYSRSARVGNIRIELKATSSYFNSMCVCTYICIYVFCV